MFSFAFIYIGLSAPPRSGGLIDPGPRSPAHASLSCEACHGPVEGGPATWLSGNDATPAADTRRCLVCHDLGDHPTAPHSVAANGLAPLTRFLSRGSDAPTSPPNQLHCATCHDEHQGRPLTPVLSDRQCSTCHQSAFSPFATAHGEFGSYPYRPVAGRVIRFDHATHLGGHLAHADLLGVAPITSCKNCHALDLRSGAMTTLPVESTCMGCHERFLLAGSGLVVADLDTGPDGGRPGALQVLAAAVLSHRGEATGAGQALQALAAGADADAVTRTWRRGVRSFAPSAAGARRASTPISGELLTRLASGEEDGTGPWRRHDTRWSYRPGSHHDPFLTGLAECLSFLARKGPADLRGAAAAALDDPSGLGVCTSCHRLAGPASDETVTWRVPAGSKPARSTHFDHGPHLTGGLGCDDCHALTSDPWLGSPPSPPGRSTGHPRAARGISDFEWMRSRSCARCHDGERASDTCSTCHTYHHGSVRPR